MPDQAEIVRHCLARLSEGDIDGVIRWYKPDAVFDASESLALSERFEGVEAARRAMEEFWETWEWWRWEPVEMTVLRPDVVLVINDVFGRGKGSGVDVAARGAQLWRFGDGLVEEVSIHQDREAAVARDRRDRLLAARLYFVCDGLPGGQAPDALLDAALRGGVDIVQLREKSPRCAEELISLSEPFRRAANAHGALFILNDRPDLVDACGADGVHVGQDDVPVAEARAAAPAGSLVGLSTHSPDQLDAAVAAEGDARPDQISVGPVWETPTKEGRPAAGLEYVGYAAGHARALPWFAIGGIDEGNAAEVAAAGATRAVVVRAIRDAADPESAAGALRAAFEEAG